MTDPHDLDELASAHLDGATTAAEAARIAADPELQARVAALQSVREALRAPVPTDPDRRDAAIDAALAAFDEDSATGAPTDRTVVPLSPRRGLSPTAMRVLGAAAVVALLALLIPLLATSDDEPTASFEETGDAISGADDAGAEAEAPQSTTTMALEERPQLGAYATVDDLLLAFDDGSSEIDGGGDVTVSQPAADAPCQVAAAGSVVAEAVVGGRAVLVLVARGADDAPRITVLDAATCAVLAERPR